MKALTIFTPTYNRAHLLPRLYESLCAQTCRDFEWIVVDDGSTDNTRQVVEQFIEQERIDIRYFEQPNGGQYRAMNIGIENAQSELFSRCDSDDYLPCNAVEIILSEWQTVKHDQTVCGVVGNCIYPDGHTVGTICQYETLVSDFLSYRSKLRIKGDRSEVVRTDIIKQFKFPEFDGEKTMPIAVIYYRMAQFYKARYFNKPIYVADYLPNGMGANVANDRRKSPQSFMLHYCEIVKFSSPGVYQFKAILNFWRTSFYTRMSLSEKLKMIPTKYILFLPLGWLIYKSNEITNEK